MPMARHDRHHPFAAWSPTSTRVSGLDREAVSASGSGTCGATGADRRRVTCCVPDTGFRSRRLVPQPRTPLQPPASPSRPRRTARHERGVGRNSVNPQRANLHSPHPGRTRSTGHPVGGRRPEDADRPHRLHAAMAGLFNSRTCSGSCSSTTMWLTSLAGSEGSGPPSPRTPGMLMRVYWGVTAAHALS